MSVHDAYNDPYARRSTASKARVKFEKLKRTQSFVSWRGMQYRIQEGRCAYCRVDLSRRGIVTHIDHVTPLYYDGRNDFENFVLACRRCNLRKWISNCYVVPQWIVDRTAVVKREQRLRLARQKQARLMQEIQDDHIWRSMRDWI